MGVSLATAGERLLFESAVPWVSALIEEGAAGGLRDEDTSAPSIRINVEAETRAFDTAGWELLTRNAWRRGEEVVVENVCTSGFDLHLKQSLERAELTYRWRPPPRDRAAARLLRSRFHLLARAVLMQYPALWWAGVRGRAPLHASACAVGTATPLLTAASGVGRSTLLLDVMKAGAQITGDNLAAADGTTVWGLIEPIRVQGGNGRRMPHGRSEQGLDDRAQSLEPDCLLVLERGRKDDAALSRCSSETAARALITNTYMAGELRRYWPFAATLSAGSGAGPAHPPVMQVAVDLAEKLPCFALKLGRTAPANLIDVLPAVEAAA